jgi:CO dehydrogenase maturation factor
VRGVVAELGTLRPEDVTILDMEASIEHLSRGTVRHVDTLLVVVEPYFRALETLGRIVPLARELGIPKIFVVANKVRSTEDDAAIRDYCDRLGVSVIGSIPFDEAVQEADRLGRTLIDYMPTAPAVLAIAELTNHILENGRALLEKETHHGRRSEA